MRWCEFSNLLLEHISEFSVEGLGLKDIVQSADESLTDGAADAIDRFVGVPHNAIKLGIDAGIMSAHKLENVYGPNPSAKGIEIRQSIDKAFAPVKQALQQKFGNVITLYRGQGKINAPGTRHTLSWTTNPEIAKRFLGVGRSVKVMSDTEIQQALHTFEQTGSVKVGQYKYVKMEDDPDYYLIYSNGQEITDGDDLQKELLDRQADQQEAYNKQQEQLKNLIKAEIPISSIIWVTDRANQSEFIVMNTPGSSWHIGNVS